MHEAELPSDWVKGGIVLPSLVTLFKIIILFIYLFLAILGLHCFVVFSLVAASGSYSLAVVQASFYSIFTCRGWILGHTGFGREG